MISLVSSSETLLSKLLKKKKKWGKKSPLHFVLSLLYCFLPKLKMGFPGGSDSKEPACNPGDLGSIPGLGRSPGGGQGNPL